MAWYEFLTLFVFLGCLVVSSVYATIWEVRRIRESIRREKSAEAFYSEAGTYFARQNDRDN